MSETKYFKPETIAEMKVKDSDRLLELTLKKGAGDAYIVRFDQYGTNSSGQSYPTDNLTVVETSSLTIAEAAFITVLNKLIME